MSLIEEVLAGFGSQLDVVLENPLVENEWPAGLEKVTVIGRIGVSSFLNHIAQNQRAYAVCNGENVYSWGPSPRGFFAGKVVAGALEVGFVTPDADPIGIEDCEDIQLAVSTIAHYLFSDGV